MGGFVSEDAEKWVLPSSIPFEALKGRDLEECVYWLMDSLGAKDLEWRTGGAGGGAADGGRDLEAWFYTPAPDGDMEGQRWWVECKGRAGTLEPEAVKNACTNALAQNDLAYLVIVTNTDFSNPTRDWVKQWQATHPRPKIKLWDKSALERMLSKHPSAVFRLFSQALSTAGLLEVAREGFWNRFDYATPKSLAAFWSERDTLAIGELERIALTISEFAHGRIDHRPWGVAGTPAEIVGTFALAMANIPYLFGRAMRSGIEQEPLIRGIAYLILATLKYVTADNVAEIILTSFSGEHGKQMPAKIRAILLEPVLNTLMGELQDVCSADCARFVHSDRSSLELGRDPIETYWYRLRPEGLPEPEEDNRKFYLEKLDVPCKVGFAMDAEHSCRLYGDQLDSNRLAELLRVVERVAEFRVQEPGAAPASEI
jgi:hypothetical protein